MSSYTVHQPLIAAGAAADPQRLVFVRDGFSWAAFLLTPLWMLWHRLWLVLAIYLLLSAGIDVLLRVLGAPLSAFVIVGLFLSLLAGLEAGTLRRFKLSRRRWRNVGVVTGDDLEDAERRFFDGWIRQGTASRAASPGASRSAPPAVAAGATEPTGVIGLFPEPGAHR
jgi:Protein of unknown function (DUF2628)